eukprot:Clim_evm39s195 gene=Clim_evmTU39s195
MPEISSDPKIHSRPVQGSDLIREAGEVCWGILGCGAVCERKSGPGLQRIEGSRLVAVQRRTPGRARDFAERHNVPKAYERPEDLINDAEVNIVYIATPPDAHLEYARMVAKAGLACYIEKPFGRCGEEAAEIVEIFSSAGLPLFAAYYRRQLQRFTLARDFVRERTGPLTDIRLFIAQKRHRSYPDPLLSHAEEAPAAGDDTPAAPSAETSANGSSKVPSITSFPNYGKLPWRVKPEISGGGLFMDLGSHCLDIIDYIVGPISIVDSSVSNRATPAIPCEDHVHILFTCDLGQGQDHVAGTAVFNFSSAFDHDELVFTGTEGSVSLPCFVESGTVTFRSVDAPSDADPEAFPTEDDPAVQLNLQKCIVRELMGEAMAGHTPSTGENALRAAHVMDDVLIDYYGTRDVGFWSMDQPWRQHALQRIENLKRRESIIAFSP